MNRGPGDREALIAVDTNILLQAHRPELPQHEAALAALERLGLSGSTWCIAWPCAHEFLAVVTSKAFKDAATPIDQALAALNAWIAHPQCRMICETADHAQTLAGLLTRSGVSGGRVHDARIAAICLAHGVTELGSADQDFQMFPDLRTRNPLVPSLHEPLPRYRTRRDA